MAGGLIYGFAGSPAPVYACATVAYCVAVGLLSSIRPNVVTRRSLTEPAGMILDGLRYIWRSKLILGCMSLDLFAVLLGGAVALLPIYSSDILHTGALGLGVLRAAPGVGAVAVAILAGALSAAETGGSYYVVLRMRIRRIHHSIRPVA